MGKGEVMGDDTCEICNETEVDTVRCAGCKRSGCIDCIEWCSHPNDYDCGDYFCSKCQECDTPQTFAEHVAEINELGLGYHGPKEKKK